MSARCSPFSPADCDALIQLSSRTGPTGDTEETIHDPHRGTRPGVPVVRRGTPDIPFVVPGERPALRRGRPGRLAENVFRLAFEPDLLSGWRAGRARASPAGTARAPPSEERITGEDSAPRSSAGAPRLAAPPIRDPFEAQRDRHERLHRLQQALRRRGRDRRDGGHASQRWLGTGPPASGELPRPPRLLPRGGAPTCTRRCLCS
jgi:hypothetical protein